ncbi:glutathione peroxidase, putative [Trypanosoma cruzi]|nr:glutathione peroxidase, putative [Trypanosoma cruzi]
MMAALLNLAKDTPLLPPSAVCGLSTETKLKQERQANKGREKQIATPFLSHPCCVVVSVEVVPGGGMGSSTVFAYSALMGGKSVALSNYTGRVTVVVNTASLCSFANSSLQQLTHVQETYGPRGFTILAFPCAQFANQEPKSNEEIAVWAQTCGLNFPLFDKVKVKGPDAHPLFQMLQASLGPIRWNYTKFICDREGIPLVKLDSSSFFEELRRSIEQACGPQRGA